MVTSRHVAPPQSSNLRNSASPIPPQPSTSKDSSRSKTYTRKPTAKSHYLTPPLTPSSSLQSDGTDHDSTDPISDLTPADSAPENNNNQHSRFLIIGNAPSDLSEDVIAQYFKSLSSPTITSPMARSMRRFSTKPIQKIFRRSPENRDFIVAFYDVRDAERAKRVIESRASKRMQDDSKAISSAQATGIAWQEALTCRLAETGHCTELLGALSPVFMTQTEGTFCISINDTSSTPDFTASRTRRHFAIPVKIRSVLEKYGDVKAFNCVNVEDIESSTQIFLAEYFDVRDADAAWEELDGCIVDSMKLRLFSRASLRDHYTEAQKEPSSFSRDCDIGGEHAAEPKTPTATTYLSQSQAASNPAAIPFPVLNDVAAGGYYPEREQPVFDSRDNTAGSQALKGRRRSTAGPHDIHTNHSDSRGEHTDINIVDTSQGQYGRRSSNHLLFDSTRGHSHQKLFDADHRKHSMYDQEQDVADASGLTLAATGTAPHLPTYYTTEYYHGAPFDVNQIQPPWVTSPPVPNPITMAMHPAPPQSPMSSPPVYWDAMSGGWVTYQSHNVLEPWTMYTSSPYYPQPLHPVAEYPFPYPASSAPLQPGTVATRPPSLAHSSSRAPPEGNQLDIKKIELGVDTRTTVMVKNIPNKMTDKELITYINKVCPRRIDFLYLRMDFQNGCNVGYAFVNFISVQDLLRFAKARLNEKWNIYSSEKVLQMSYANYQGKEALVEKFKNSCIMDEREEWRPKIFFSDPGPNQGLPEEFPKPTHIRRKERSSYNRGTLYPPGVSTGAGHFRYLNAGNVGNPNPRHPATRPSGEDRRRRRGIDGGVSFPSLVGAEAEDTTRSG